MALCSLQCREGGCGHDSDVAGQQSLRWRQVQTRRFPQCWERGFTPRRVAPDRGDRATIARSWLALEAPHGPPTDQIYRIEDPNCFSGLI